MTTYNVTFNPPEHLRNRFSTNEWVVVVTAPNAWAAVVAARRELPDGYASEFSFASCAIVRSNGTPNAGEQGLYDWQHRAPMGSFMACLWSALEVADTGNLDKLALGWPEHVDALRRYRTEPGYWPALKARIEV